jgi:NAD-dependent dihydropyrimidine dehydrogenase PreA subunit
MTQRITVILSRNRTATKAEADLESQLESQLGRRVDVFEIPHLYDLPPDGTSVELLWSIDGDMVVLAWLYPRSSYWVLRANEVEGRFLDGSGQPEEEDSSETSAGSATDEPGRTIWCLDLREHNEPEPFVEAIERIASLAQSDLADEASRPQVEAVEETTSQRWYPIIDFDRCTHCLECLNFCLFGVFGVGTSNEIIIEEPDACRAGCPACSRICPQGAIMFPQHGDPAIAGDANASLESLKLDLSQLFAGINPAEMAATERDRALAERRGQESDGSTVSGASPGRKDDLDRLVDELDDLEL